jgi:hypothetical protein
MKNKKFNPQILSSFKVSLSRLGKGESAIPPPPRNEGQRTKFGGKPDWIQYDETPVCDQCGKKMLFVAQIDSLDHMGMNNPFRYDKPDDARSWMFGDVGMIYLFFCFNCREAKCAFQDY